MRLSYVLVLLIVTIGVLYLLQLRSSPSLDPHAEAPIQQDDPPFDVEALAAQIQESEYFSDLQSLEGFVRGRTVTDTEAGNAGFLLILDNETWVAAFRDGEQVGHSMGSGEPTAVVRNSISSSDYGDARQPISAQVPYADAVNDIAAEVAKSHGQVISGLAYGLGSFNYAFSDGHELDVKLVADRSGRPALRVFWEQW